MASNALASIAAATAAGYVLERTTSVTGGNITRLKKQVSGQPGASGGPITFQGEGTTSGNADTAALANLNFWRLNRYGNDSAQANVSTIQDPKTYGSHKAQDGTTHSSLTKDVN